MVGIAGVLGHHVGGGRTRALRHHDRFISAVRRRKINDDSRKDGGALEDEKPAPIPQTSELTVGGGSSTHSSQPCR